MATPGAESAVCDCLVAAVADTRQFERNPESQSVLVGGTVTLACVTGSGAAGTGIWASV